MKILVGVPCATDMVHADFAFSLITASMWAQKNNIELGIVSERNCLVDVARNNLCEAAIQMGADYLMMTDCDMLLDYRTIPALSKQGVDVAWVLASKRMDPPMPVCDPAHKLATGCIMITRKVLMNMTPPWFKVSWEGPVWTGEDFYFSERVKAQGFSTRCVNLPIGHIGQKVYRLAEDPATMPLPCR
jgi:hypothetical protein